MLSPKTRLRHRLAALTFSLCCIGIAAADTPRYAVEVIVFENLGGNVAGAELWSRTNQEPLPEADETLGLDAELRGQVATRKPPATVHQPLDDAALQLSDLRATLERSGRYKILTHHAWQQPGLDRDKAAPFTVEIPLAAPQPERVENTPTPAPAQSPDNWYPMAPVVQAPEPHLEGELKLVLSRYLHLEADLRYYTGELHQPMLAIEDEFADISVQPVVYRLKESRRMRSGELHYLDHPAFGLIARVTPYPPR